MATRSTLYLLALAWLLTSATNSTFAQNDMDPSLPGGSFEISGQVSSPDGRKMIQFVTVRLERGGGLVDQRTTDSTGRFRFSRLNPGNYFISASAPGFRIAPQQVDISRFIPRVHLLLQLAPEEETFRKRPSAGGVVDANVPERARSEFERGRTALADKKVEEGILHLERAIAFHGNYYEAQELIASAFMEQENWVKASLALRRALEINPKAVTVMVSLGEVYRRQKNYEEGEKVLKNGLALNDKSWLGHYTLGRIYWEKKDLINAGKQIAFTLQLEPAFPDARLLAGNIFVRARMPENAIIEYEEYLRIEPKGQFAGEIRELVQKLKSLIAKKKS
ncbi:MAG: carboxypeptidase regulatory-like domain-containing protein [Pyrinomonadaceae bacterium]